LVSGISPSSTIEASSLIQAFCGLARLVMMGDRASKAALSEKRPLGPSAAFVSDLLAAGGDFPTLDRTCSPNKPPAPIDRPVRTTTARIVETSVGPAGFTAAAGAAGVAAGFAIAARRSVRTA
jgi:hypothetical protein